MFEAFYLHLESLAWASAIPFPQSNIECSDTFPGSNRSLTK